MATVSQLKERVASLLPPGSEVQQAFVCQTATNFGIFVINWLTGLTVGLISYRCVAVTADAIYVLDAHPLSGGATPAVRHRHAAQAHSTGSRTRTVE